MDTGSFCAILEEWYCTCIFAHCGKYENGQETSKKCMKGVAFRAGEKQELISHTCLNSHQRCSTKAVAHSSNVLHKMMTQAELRAQNRYAVLFFNVMIRFFDRILYVSHPSVWCCVLCSITPRGRGAAAAQRDGNTLEFALICRYTRLTISSIVTLKRASTYIPMYC